MQIHWGVSMVSVIHRLRDSDIDGSGGMRMIDRATHTER